MRMQVPVVLIALLMLILAACGQPGQSTAAGSQDEHDSAMPAEEQARLDSSRPEILEAASPPSAPDPAHTAGAGLAADEPDREGNLVITIRWSSRTVTGDPDLGQTTTVYNRTTQLQCPVVSGAVATSSYFAVFDNPDGDPMAATGSYQPWWNEACTGTMTIDDSVHADDKTISGPEPTVHTTGTQTFDTSDTPLTVETDLNRARTRYMFLVPHAEGFRQEAIENYIEGRLVPASAAPMPTLDITREGPIGDGKDEIPVQGGVVQIEWTFSRGAAPTSS